jgi:hypothetical protein
VAELTLDNRALKRRAFQKSVAPAGLRAAASYVTGQDAMSERQASSLMGLARRTGTDHGDDCSPGFVVVNAKTQQLAPTQTCPHRTCAAHLIPTKSVLRWTEGRRLLRVSLSVRTMYLCALVRPAHRCQHRGCGPLRNDRKKLRSRAAAPFPGTQIPPLFGPLTRSRDV